MFGSTFRRTILLATIPIASLVPRIARAQNPLGVAGDLVALKANQWFLKHDRDRLQADIDRGDAAAANRDLRRVRRDVVRVDIDRRWLRSDLFLPNMFAPLPDRPPRVTPDQAIIPHPQYPGFGYFPSDPTHLYHLPQTASVAGTANSAAGAAVPAQGPTTAAAEVPIEIVNAGRTGQDLDFVVDGVAYKIEGGARRRLAVGPAPTIAFDRGGGLGEQRYSLSAGVYEFRPGGSGWAFFKLRPTP